MTDPWAPPDGPPPDPWAPAPPAWPAWPAYPPYDARFDDHETNPWAVVALVTGIIALFPFAIAAGIAALVQIRRNGDRGTAMAVAGLVCAGLWMVIVAVIVIGSSTDSGPLPALGRVDAAGSTTVGTCLLHPTAEELQGSPVDCGQPHDAEIYAVAGLDNSAWPGSHELDSEADGVCGEAFSDYVGSSYDDSDFDYAYFVPDRAEWEAGESRTICVIVSSDDSQLVGSAQASGR